MAGIPLWSITPSGGSQPTQQVYRFGSVDVAYLVQNNSRSKTITLGMLPRQGTSVSPAQCILRPQGQSNNSCVMTVTIQGDAIPNSGLQGGPQFCAMVSGVPNPLQCYQPAQANVLNISITEVAPVTTLSASVSDLVLATDGIFTTLSGTGGAVSSKSRTITITNTGAQTANNVQYSISPALPAGTVVTPASCGNIAPGGNCVLTVIPGTTPSASANQAPTPSVMSVQGSNTPTVTSNITLLTYGNIYQGGFVFAIDDNTLINTSVGGKVVSQLDQSTGLPWSQSDSSVVPGIQQTSTPSTPVPALPASPPAPPYAGCLGSFDGNCDTSNILLFLINSVVPPLNYAAGICTTTISGFSDWYLPAICEWGYGRGLCGGTPANAQTQNVASNIYDRYYATLGNFANLIDVPNRYWSSTTDDDGFGGYNPKYQYFNTGFSDQGNDEPQTTVMYVRCVRNF